MKCRHRNLLIQKKQMSAMVLGLTFCAPSQYQAMRNKYIHGQIKVWKAIYKISKINTIFIIDMLQKIPLVTASVYVKVLQCIRLFYSLLFLKE